MGDDNGHPGLWQDYCLLSSHSSQFSVQGRLLADVQFWEDELVPSSFVLGIVKYGYVVPFVWEPHPLFSFNHPSTKSDGDFVVAEIKKLVESSCIVEVDSCPTVCSPLLVVVNSNGKKRLVIDLRYVNHYLPKYKFKYEGLNLVPDLCGKGDYFVAFDLKSGYHHVDINVNCWKYLGFSWLFDGIRRFFVFRVLPFGLSTACYVFTKLLRPLVRRWRSAGLRVVIYIDDGLCVASSAVECVRNRDLILMDLKYAGFVVNMEKSQLVPSQVGSWLGFEIDLGHGTYRVPEHKIVRLKEAIGNIGQLGRVPARAVASIVGQIISMSLAIGSISRLRTRYLYCALNERRSWSDRVLLSDAAREELFFWVQCVNSLNGKPIWCDPGACRVVYSDASSVGYGGYVVEVANDVARGRWSSDEALLSSTWRELKAVYSTLQSFTPQLEGFRVKWFTDNQAVKSIVSNGSRKQHLQDGAMAIFELCLHHGIRLEMEWVPREQNEMADYLSKVVDYDDWMVDPLLFEYINSLWGPHSVDCFASHYNAQFPRFFSRFWCPGAEAIDAFTVSWRDEVCWWVPPLHLIPRVVSHAQVCSGKGTLIAPVWTSAPYWPLLCPSGSVFAPFVVRWLWLPYHEGLIKDGQSSSSFRQSLTDSSLFMALFLDFST